MLSTVWRTVFCRFSMPSPVRAETAVIGAFSRVLPASSRRIVFFRLSISARAARSHLLMTITPAVMPSRDKIAKCSRVCAIKPSSAATKSKAISTAATPPLMVRTNFSCPGTSMMSAVIFSLSRQGANPSSMVMPRLFSAGRRSVSTPVSLCTRAVLPWSTCPAVPMIILFKTFPPNYYYLNY